MFCFCLRISESISGERKSQMGATLIEIITVSRRTDVKKTCRNLVKTGKTLGETVLFYRAAATLPSPSTVSSKSPLWNFCRPPPAVGPWIHLHLLTPLETAAGGRFKTGSPHCNRTPRSQPPPPRPLDAASLLSPRRPASISHA